MRFLWILALSIELGLVGGTAKVLAQDVEDIKSEIDLSPFLSSGPKIEDIEVKEGYLFVSVSDVSEAALNALRSNAPLSSMIGTDPDIANLLRIEEVLIKQFELKAVYWTPLPSVPNSEKDFFDKLSKFVLMPGVGITAFRLGDPIESAIKILDAELVRDTAEIRTAQRDLGSVSIYIYAKGGSRVTGVRLIDNVVFDNGSHGTRELRSLIGRYPRTQEGIGLGSTRDEVTDALGEPVAAEMWELGSCGIAGRTDEHLLYAGMRLRLCDGIVTDVTIE